MDVPVRHPSAGATCIAFANTWSAVRGGGVDRIRSYEKLVAWSVHASLLTSPDAAELCDEATRAPANAGRAFAEARELRRAIVATLSAHSDGTLPTTADLEPLNTILAKALPSLGVRIVGGRCTLAWTTTTRNLDIPVWRLAAAAAELLVSDDVRLLHQCEAKDCWWFFLDRSHARRRRWCDMATCGNREKARRHYRRTAEKLENAPRG